MKGKEKNYKSVHVNDVRDDYFDMNRPFRLHGIFANLKVACFRSTKQHDVSPIFEKEYICFA